MAARGASVGSRGGLANPDSPNTSREGGSGKVTIPIDWDYIIDKYIKNTNTNVNEANKSAKRDNEESEEDDFF